MPNYNDFANQQMPSLAELAARIRARRAAEAARNPGARPEDRMGRQQQVSIEGEAPIQAQPVAPQHGRVGVDIGPVSQPVMQLPGVRVQVPARQTPSAHSPDPRAARLRQLMAQGMTFDQAMRRIQTGG